MLIFNLKDKIMRQSIYLHTVMCMYPDTVKTCGPVPSSRDGGKGCRVSSSRVNYIKDLL